MAQFCLPDNRNNYRTYRSMPVYKLATIRKSYPESSGIHFSQYNSAYGLISPGCYSKREVNLTVEQSSAPYLIGVELEVENVGSRAILTEALSPLATKYVLVTDGSLRDSGAEIVTLPLHPNSLVSSTWYKALKAISSAGMTSYDSGRCGLHLNVSMKYLKVESWSALKRFLTRHKEHFKHISQRDSYSYCEFQNSPGKYRALNLDKSNVAEFRFFRGNLKPERFFGAVETIRALVETAKDCEVEGKRLTWTRYAKTVARYKYAKALFDRAPQLVRSERTGVSRPRRTMSDIAIRLSQVINARFDYGSRIHRFDSMSQAVAIDHEQREIRIQFRVGSMLASYHDRSGLTSRTYDVTPSNFRFNYLPRSIFRDIQRLMEAGWIFSARISSDFPLREGLTVAIHHYSGGWGRRSSFSPVLE